MNATRAPIADFGRAARRVFAVMSRKISSAVERIATSGSESASEYPRFPWF